jgi:hypothetical protein
MIRPSYGSVTASANIQWKINQSGAAEGAAARESRASISNAERPRQLGMPSNSIVSNAA